MDETSKERLKSVLRRNGLKYTPQREAVYAELFSSGEHPSAGAVYRRVRRVMPNISLDTVYRTLLMFSGVGLINMVEGYGGETRFEPNLDGHHHFRCLTCHRIIDFYDESLRAADLPARLEGLVETLNASVALEGVCKSCAEKPR